MNVEQVGYGAVVVVFLSFLVSFVILIFFTWFGWKKEGRRGDTCPYTHEPMRLGVDIATSLTGYVNAFIKEQEQPDNPDIDFAKAAYCPKTGRIFPECVQPGEQVSLSWDFIKRRYKGTFVPWGALSEEERGVIKLLHDSLEGFQTEKNSLMLRPEDIEEDLATVTPGPLYVDRSAKILMGWKKVPGTYFEVLVVQKPKFQSLEETL